MLRRRGEVTRYIPPISLMLGAGPATYIDGLSAYRAGNVSEWCELFAEATERASAEAQNLAEAIEDLEESITARIEGPASWRT